jgi:hypothetical protein
LSLTPDPRAEQLRNRYSALGLSLPPILLLGMSGDLPVFGWRVDRGDPLEQWRALRTRHADTGMWPFLLGKPDAVGETLSFAGGDHQAGQVEGRARIDPGEWFRDHDPRAAASATTSVSPARSRQLSARLCWCSERCSRLATMSFVEDDVVPGSRTTCTCPRSTTAW